jgi:hypothetical protein
LECILSATWELSLSLSLSLSLCMVAVKKENISKTVENFFSTNITNRVTANEVTLKE